MSRILKFVSSVGDFGANIGWVSLAILATVIFVANKFDSMLQLLFPPDQHAWAWVLVAISLFVILSIIVGILLWFIFRHKPLLRWHFGMHRLLSQHKDPPEGRELVHSFLNEYARREANHILESEHTPGHQIYTSFISYSNLVQTTINAGREHPKIKNLVCLTTLKMPLPQWFNNKLDKTKKHFPFLEADRNWVAYLKFMHDLSFNRPIRIFRYIQTCSDISKEEGKSLYDDPLIGEQTMKEYAHAQILLPQNDGQGVDFKKWIGPFDSAEIQNVLAKVKDPKLEESIKSNYAARQLSYLILPKADQPYSKIVGFEWHSVGSAFEHMFGSKAGHSSDCHVVRIKKKRMNLLFGSKDPMPNDVFLLGSRLAKDEVQWLLTMAATTDDDCQLVRLEFDTNKSQSPRLENVPGYVTSLMDGRDNMIVSLDTWMDST